VPDLISDGTGGGTCLVDSVFATSVPPPLEQLFGRA